jgi:hypothetical protein
MSTAKTADGRRIGRHPAAVYLRAKEEAVIECALVWDETDDLEAAIDLHDAVRELRKARRGQR